MKTIAIILFLSAAIFIFGFAPSMRMTMDVGKSAGGDEASGVCIENPASVCISNPDGQDIENPA